MALKLRDLYGEHRRRFQLELIAGEAGLDNLLSWVYVAENYTTSHFLHGGELIITTGVISGGSPDWLLEFLHHMTAQHTCGLILNEGPYFRREMISQAALDYCEEQRYPLMLMPWHIHIYDITRTFCNRIFIDTRRDEEINRAFVALAEGAGDQAAAIARLGSFQFPADAPYYAAVFSMPGHPELSPADSDRLMTQLSAELLHQDFPCYLAARERGVFLVCQCGEAAPVETLTRRLQQQIDLHYHGELCAAGVGGRADCLGAIAASCRQARATLQLGLLRGQRFFRYDDAGFFRLLMAIPDLSVLRAYVADQLGPVLDYDRRHNSDLARTLQLYLLHDGSIQAVAAQAFCHRNTVNHRLHILKETLGYILDSPAVRFELLSAFLAREYLESREILTG
ncbi:MAG: PucR family transcriptional regulator [Candidatus Onthomonas sp.]